MNNENDANNIKGKSGAGFTHLHPIRNLTLRALAISNGAGTHSHA